MQERPSRMAVRPVIHVVAEPSDDDDPPSIAHQARRAAAAKKGSPVTPLMVQREKVMHHLAVDVEVAPPMSPNLSRIMDTNRRARSWKRVEVVEEEARQEARLRRMGMGPSLRLSQSQFSKKIQSDIGHRESGTLVTHPSRQTADLFLAWRRFEERMTVEYQFIEESSFKLLFGKLEKPNRTGRGLRDEPVPTLSPYQDTRVCLSAPAYTDPEDDPTYINANRILHRYVGASFPQTKALRNAFWQMIWELGSSLVIMLNSEKEQHGKHTFKPYWPKQLLKPKQYGALWVTKTEHTLLRHMGAILRRFRVSVTPPGDAIRDSSVNLTPSKSMVQTADEGRAEVIVSHLQAINWPDMGLPEKNEFVDFLKFTDTLDNGDARVIVHCFGGKGRTGTFIAIRHLWHELRDNPSADMDVCGTVSLMRSQRPCQIQTLEQYKFVYLVLGSLLQV